jgi:hypothetical protein
MEAPGSSIQQRDSRTAIGEGGKISISPNRVVQGDDVMIALIHSSLVVALQGKAPGHRCSIVYCCVLVYSASA